MARPTTAQPAAFTLIELVLVLAMLALLLGLAVPSVRGWGQGAKLRSTTDQVLTATRWARSRAVTTAVPHRLEASADGVSYQVVADEPETAPAGAEFAGPVQLPEGFRVEVVRADGGQALEFHPNGRATPGAIRLTAEWGEEVVIEARTPAESFRNVTAVAGGGR